MLIGAFPLVNSPFGLIFQIYVSVQPEFTFKLSIDCIHFKNQGEMYIRLSKSSALACFRFQKGVSYP